MPCTGLISLSVYAFNTTFVKLQGGDADKAKPKLGIVACGAGSAAENSARKAFQGLRNVSVIRQTEPTDNFCSCSQAHGIGQIKAGVVSGEEATL